MYDATELFFPLVATSAAVAVVSLVLLQTDAVSRKILDPAQLDTKRRSEYRYNWKKAVDKTKLQIEYCLAGGIQKYNDDPEIVMKNTEYVSNEDDLNALVEKITDEKDTQSKFYVLKFDKDPHDPTDGLYLFLVQEQTSSNDKITFQVPLIEFGTKLADAFDNQPTRTALCFVADASAGSATKLLKSLMKESRIGVAVISEPFWMIQMARLVEASIVASEKIQKLVYSLCRLDAMSVRHEVGCAKMVMFTLPGQAVVPILLPLLHGVFPTARHVFACDGCLASVKRGIYRELTHRRSALVPDLKLIIRGMCKDPVQVTTPFPSKFPLSHNASLGGSGGALERALAQVPLQQARNVEAWISSVDAFTKLENKETSNEEPPYCMKQGPLTNNPIGNFERGTDSFRSLESVLQYVTGRQDRVISEENFDAAKEWLKEYNLAQAEEQKKIDSFVKLSDHDRIGIENCCSQHRQILTTMAEAHASGR